MSGLKARDLADKAERVAGDAVVPDRDVPPSADPIDLALSGAAENLTPWALPHGARLRFVRGLLLRIIQPFAERQNLFNGYLAASAALQSDELAALRRRVEELEAAQQPDAAGDSDR